MSQLVDQEPIGPVPRRAVPRFGPPAEMPPRAVGDPRRYPLVGVAPKKNKYNFLASRSDGQRYHAGVDLKAPVGTPVVATERGVVVKVQGFYKGTKAVLVATKPEASIVWGPTLVFGEVDPVVVEGQWLLPGDLVGHVGDLDGDSMLHFETRTPTFKVYKKSTGPGQGGSQWWVGEPAPSTLLDPRDYVRRAAGLPPLPADEPTPAHKDAGDGGGAGLVLLLALLGAS